MDKYNLFIFGYVLLITMESTIIGYNNHMNDGWNNLERFDQVFGQFCAVLFVVGNLVFIQVAYTRNHRELGKLGKFEPYAPDIIYASNDEGIKPRIVNHH